MKLVWDTYIGNIGPEEFNVVEDNESIGIRRITPADTHLASTVIGTLGHSVESNVMRIYCVGFTYKWMLTRHNATSHHACITICTRGSQKSNAKIQTAVTKTLHFLLITTLAPFFSWCRWCISSQMHVLSSALWTDRKTSVHILLTDTLIMGHSQLVEIAAPSMFLLHLFQQVHVSK